MRGKGAGGPLEDLGGDLRHGDGRESQVRKTLLKAQNSFHKSASLPTHVVGDTWKLETINWDGGVTQAII